MLNPEPSILRTVYCWITVDRKVGQQNFHHGKSKEKGKKMQNNSDPNRETIRAMCGSIQRDWDTRTATKRRFWAAARQQALARKMNDACKSMEDSEATEHFIAV